MVFSFENLIVDVSEAELKKLVRDAILSDLQLAGNVSLATCKKAGLLPAECRFAKNNQTIGGRKLELLANDVRSTVATIDMRKENVMDINDRDDVVVEAVAKLRCHPHLNGVLLAAAKNIAVAAIEDRADNLKKALALGGEPEPDYGSKEYIAEELEHELNDKANSEAFASSLHDFLRT